MPARDVAVTRGHFMSMYDLLNSNRDTKFRRFSSDSGRLVSTSNTSQFRAPVINSESRASACVLYANHSDCSSVSVTHRTPYGRRPLGILRIFQKRTLKPSHPAADALSRKAFARLTAVDGACRYQERDEALIGQRSTKIYIQTPRASYAVQPKAADQPQQRHPAHRQNKA